MADVTVTTWAGLVDALRNATEDSTIYLEADIDLNDVPEARTGITEQIKCANYKLILDGQNHEIKNLYCSSLRNPVFTGYSLGKPLTIRNIKFSNIRLDESRTGVTATTLLQNGNVTDSVISAMTSGNSRLWGSPVGLSRCGITVIGDTGTSYTIGDNKHYFCNIVLKGYFASVAVHLYNSYLGGDFTITGTGVNNLSFSSSYIGVVNADIYTATSSPYIYTNNAKSLLINKDRLKDLTGEPINITEDLLSPAKDVTTEQLLSSSELQRLDFPCQ